MAESNGECAMTEEKLDSTRTLLLTGLKELENHDGTCDEKMELLKEAVQNMMAEFFSLPIDTVEKVVRTTNDEGSPAVLVLFKSRLNKNRVYTQREKLPESVKAALYLTQKVNKNEENIESEKKEELTGDAAVEEQAVNDFVVRVGEEGLGEKQTLNEEIKTNELETKETEKGSDEVGQEKTVQKQTIGDEEPKKIDEPKIEETERQPTQGIMEATTTNDAVEEHHNEMANDGDVDLDDMEEHEHTEVDEPKAASNLKIKESDSPKEVADKEKKFDWVGCPEFQWKRVSNDEKVNLILDDISLTDLKNPFLYRTVLRARQVTMNFKADMRGGNIENSVLGKGRLVLTFGSDSQAIAQASNSLVFMRTPADRKIRIYLPQTDITLKQSKALEEKMGRIQKLNFAARQLLVRNVSKECDEEMIKLKFGVAPIEISKIEFREDGIGRRCAVVSFSTPEFAISAHLKHNKLKVGEDGNWSPVLYMRDVLPKQLMLKPEVKHSRKQGKLKLVPNVSHDSKTVSPTKAAQDIKKETTSTEKSKVTPNTKGGVAKSSTVVVESAKSVSQDAEKPKSTAKRNYPDKSGESQPTPKKRRQRSKRGRGGAPKGGFPEFIGTPKVNRNRSEILCGVYEVAEDSLVERTVAGNFNRGRIAGPAASIAGPTGRSPAGRSPAGRTNPWMSDSSSVSVGGPSLDSLQTMITEQQRKFEMQQQLLRQQEVLEKMQVEIDRRNVSSSKMIYGSSASGYSASGYPASAMSSGYLPMASSNVGSTTPSAQTYGSRTRYNGPAGNRPYSPPLYRSPPRGNDNYRN